jgi:hypothetical protein
MLASLIAGIAVGMELHGKLAESRFQFLVVAPFNDAKRLVEINLHRALPASSPLSRLSATLKPPLCPDLVSRAPECHSSRHLQSFFRWTGPKFLSRNFLVERI